MVVVLVGVVVVVVTEAAKRSSRDELGSQAAGEAQRSEDVPFSSSEQVVRTDLATSSA